MLQPDPLHPLRPFLKNYVWEHGHIGTRYLNCATGEISFDDGKKSRFAAEKYLYIPLDKNAPDDPLATGPSTQDAALARFLRAAQLGKPEEAGSAAEVQRAVHDCVDLAIFSAYQHDALQAVDHYTQEAMFDDEIRAALVSDIRKVYGPMREQLALYDFTVLHGLPTPLLFSDAPFIDWRIRVKPAMPFVSLPLGPYALLVGTPSGRTSRAAPVAWKTAVSMGALKDHNRLMVERARLWIVATSDDQLVSIQDRFKKDDA
ncbi:hypothetical protein PQR68_29950 [Paraburkholderia agricolaris]|uniref:DUF4238 domain-containing protein n=1 Tax=Paraburkholderia agricolaris TaxID=2152888 RepID=A0ABW8ZXW0_9BURK